MTIVGETRIPARSLLERLLEYDSRDKIHDVIRTWIQANPPPQSLEDIYARVDEILAPWYAVYGDPRARELRREHLVKLAEAMSGPTSEPLGPRYWTFQWLATPNPRLDGRRPEESLDSIDGFERLKQLIRTDGTVERSGRNAE